MNRHHSGVDISTSVITYLSGAPRITICPDGGGGPYRHVTGMIRGFEANGFQVQPFIYGDYVSRRITGKGGAIQARRLEVPGMRYIQDVARLIAARYARNLLGREIEIASVALAYERYALYHHLGYKFQRKGVPWVLETNGVYFRELGEHYRALGSMRLARRHEAWAYRECDMLVTISQKLKTKIVDEFNLEPDKVIVVGNGVDTDCFSTHNLPPSGIVTSAGLTVGYVGSMSTVRAPELLLRAVAAARSSGADIRAVFIGGGAELERLRLCAVELMISQYVIFYGAVEGTRIPELMGKFDVGFMGQRPDLAISAYTSPLKLYEYLATGRPVVYSAISSVQQEVGGQSFAFCLDEYSVAALAGILERLNEMRDELPELGRKAAEFARRNCSWSSRAAQVFAEVQKRGLAKA